MATDDSHHYADFRVGRANPDTIGTVSAQSTALTPRYDFTGDEWYVRARVVSDKPKTNPFADGDTEMAWTQPVPVAR